MLSQKETDGFVLYLSSFAALLLYLIWALVPDTVLEKMHITYYPSKEWARVLPVWLIGLIPLTLAMFAAVNLLNTPPLQSRITITDEHAAVKQQPRLNRHDTRLQDVPITRSAYLESLEPDGQSFIAGRSFQVQYATGGAGVAWTAGSSNCVFASPGAAASTVTCGAAGVEALAVSSAAVAADTLFVTVGAPRGCFRWLLAAGARRVVAASATGVARVWVADPARLGAEEALGTAAAPSANSKALSTAFANVGEYPDVALAGTGAALLSVGDFNAAGYWEVTYSATSAHSLATTIKGHSISIMDCSIEPLTTMIYVQPASQSTWFTATTAAAGGSASFAVFSNACASNIMLATSNVYGSGNLAISMSYFLVTNEPVLTAAFNLDASGIKSIAASSLGVSILTTNSAVYYVDLNSTTAVRATGLSSTLTNIKSATICSTKSVSLNSHIVTWNNQAATTFFFYSLDGGKTFTKFDLASKLGASSTARIKDVLISQQLLSYIVMVRDNSDDKLFVFNPFLATASSAFVFSLSTRLIDATNAVPVSMTEGVGSLLFSGDALYLSPDFGQTMFPITLQSRNPALPAAGLASGEYIKQTSISQDVREFAVLTSNNRIFYGKTGISVAIELSGGLLSSQSAQIGFDGLQRLIVYTPSSSASYVVSRIISIPNEVLSPRAPIASNPTLVCPYSSWTTDLLSDYILDMGESFTITANVTAGTTTVKDIAMSFSNYSILSVNSSTSSATSNDALAPSSNLVTLSTTIQVSPRSNLLSGTTQIGIRPNSANLACPNQFQTASCTVGCPTTRRMILRNPATNGSSLIRGHSYPSLTTLDCTKAPASIYLPPGTWVSDWTTFSRPNYEKHMSYNCSSMGGPPIDVFYGTAFQPVLDVFDGDVFVKTVTANFGVWEVNGRTFGYNLTNSKVGCRSAVQTWSGLFQAAVAVAGGVAVEAGSVWGSNNYVNCFQDGGTLTNPNDAYTIFNSTNKLGIVWTGGYDGIYVLTAKVLDSDFSYCSLTTTFAVNVYGAPVAASVQAGIVIGFMFLFCGILAGSYFWYLSERRREARERELEEEAAAAEGSGDESEDGDEVLWKEKLE
ncbi:cation channel sperm-associated protein subunit delta-domain-containing protein [Obelidium mucronatum]|nr:cation channel sperm-associated protein subunit delta-domain-containing protein [Obelidium mucronatum]